MSAFVQRASVSAAVFSALLGASSVLCSAADSAASPAPFASHEVAINVDSGVVRNTDSRPAIIFATDIVVPGARWLRLRFEESSLAGGFYVGDESYLVIRSHQDGATQTLNAITLSQWRNTSAYFNGPRVRLELHAFPNTGPNRVVVSVVVAGEKPAESICGEDDDRTLVDPPDPRIGRAPGCTAFIIDDDFHCLLSAGHCTLSTLDVVQFNVPLSESDGSPNHPPPEFQFAVDPSSLQFENNGVGSDWAYFGCFPNSETGLSPFQTQQAAVVLTTVPEKGGDDIRITGFGNTLPRNEMNRVQATHTASLQDVDESVLYYNQLDTSGGNSGSPVLDLNTGSAIGIHTHGGCTEDPESGANRGTRIDNPLLVEAMGKPLGVCASFPEGNGDFNADGDLDISDFAEFQQCFTGPGDDVRPGCGRADFDGDGDVDFGDFWRMSDRFTGDCGVLLTREPDDVTLCLGERAVFRIAAEGVDVRYGWTLNGAEIEDETGPVLVVDPVEVEGVYRGFALGGCHFVASREALLNLADPPTLTAVPGDVMTCLEETVEFSVAAVGQEPLSYQWQFGGDDIPGATQSSYVIESVTYDDLGDYTAVVTDRCDQSVDTEEAPASLSLIPPEIVEQPLSAVACRGDSAAFSVSAVGENPVTYQWQLDRQDIPGAEGEFYIIAAVSSGDLGSYRCRVKDGCGGEAYSLERQLDLGKVVFEAGPVGGTFCTGDTVFLVPEFTAVETTFQWLKDDSPIPGANSPFLAISDVGLDDSGAYRLLATAPCNEDLSEAAVVVVIDCGDGR